MHTFRRRLALLLVLLTLTWAGVVASAEPDLPDAACVEQPLSAEIEVPLAGSDADDDGVADALEMPVLPGLRLSVEGAPRPLKVARFAVLIPIPLAPPPAPPPRLV